MGDWQQRETALALDRQAHESDFPVIPVLLPDADPPFGILALNTWVDLRGGITDDIRISVIARAAQGEPPRPKAAGENRQAIASVCILDDVGDEPGNLPLLEFVLAELWEQRRGGILHHAAYEQMGGIQGAIAARAGEVFAHLDAAQQAVARRILVQMVRPGEETVDTRQRTLLPSDAVSLAVIRCLADARLAVTARDKTLATDTEVIR